MSTGYLHTFSLGLLVRILHEHNSAYVLAELIFDQN